MSKKKFKTSQICLENMVLHCRKIRSYIGGVTLENLMERDLEFDAIVARLQALGENVNRIEKGEEKIIQKFPQAINWVGLRRLRDVLSHNYEGLAEKSIFEFAKNDINDVETGALQILRQRYGVKLN